MINQKGINRKKLVPFILSIIIFPQNPMQRIFEKQTERKFCQRDSDSHCPVIWRFAIWYWVLSVTATEPLSNFAAIPSGNNLKGNTAGEDQPDAGYRSKPTGYLG